MNYFCIDIDNTIAKTDEVMRRVISDFTNGRVQLEYEDIVTFNYHECPDRQTNQITKEEWRQVHDLFSESKYLTNIEPMPGAIEGLRRLVERGTVHLATSRLRKARKATVEWLDHHGFPDHDLHFLRHGEKHAALKQFTAAVEDHYEQAVAFATIGATPCFLIRHPWNRTKSECMRFVHSCCSLVVFFSRNVLDSGCDRRLLIKMGELVQPWSVFVEVPHNIANQIA